MTTKDRTRNQLVGSMRKTKAVAGIGKDSVETGAVAAKNTRQTNSGQTKAGQTVAQRSKRVPVKPQPLSVSADDYQIGQRVWPD